MPSAEPLPSRLTSQSSGSSVSRTRICPPGLGVLVEEEPERADGARPPTRQAASRPPPPAAAAPALRRGDAETGSGPPPAAATGGEQAAAAGPGCAGDEAPAAHA